MLTQSMSRFLRWFAALVALVPVIIVVACGEDPPPTHLQPNDLDLPDGGDLEKFDKNQIIPLAAFTDGQGVSAELVQEFLAKTPYNGRKSFLETYQSNGIRAADAIVLAARQHRINPIVFLVYAQAMEGLVGERYYPFPPERVEYVFRCGCLQSKDCLPELAGFDRQLDCLGRILRDNLDAIRTNKKTAAGWGDGKTSITLDDVEVTPEDRSTAAIYDRTPRVAEGGAGGTWLIWNVWNHYSGAVGYWEPAGGGEGRWIGEPCASSSECSETIPEPQCAVGPSYQDGLCTADCDKGSPCPSEDGKPGTFCTKFVDDSGAISYSCLATCNAAAGSAGCREGFQCVRRAGLADTQADVCEPPVD